MKTIMARTPHESSFSYSKRYFNWKINNSEHEIIQDQETNPQIPNPRKPLTLPKLKFNFTNLFSRTKPSKISGTLFGHRRGHVIISFQENPNSRPNFLIEISTPTAAIVREMASGLVRVALECDRRPEKSRLRLIEEPLWRAYCNGSKCGYATRREAGEEDMRVLEAVGRVSMGAGVLPGGAAAAAEGEIMYMRAKFERVVGSSDSEAFYMVNPDGNCGGPELSVYLLRV